MAHGRLYDAIGEGYRVTRRTEPRIAARIWEALGDARTVLNVGAGTGSYEPPDRDVIAVEPSAVMRAQRPPRAAPCLAAEAGGLPFRDRCFDTARPERFWLTRDYLPEFSRLALGRPPLAELAGAIGAHSVPIYNGSRSS